jgi:hypothetical protein
MCTSLFLDPPIGPAQTLKCARMQCSITTDVSWVQPVGSPVTMLVTCRNPGATTFKWYLSAWSDAGCPAPQAPADTTNNITVVSSGSRTCRYEVVTGDGASNTGWVLYGLRWQ